MSYIPPHKRPTKGSPSPKPTPVPESLVPSLRKNLNIKSSGEQKRKQKYLGGKIVYANDAVSKWFTVGLADNSQFSSLVRLQPFPAESFERKSGQNPHSLVLIEGCSESTTEFKDKAWSLVEENVKQDLLLSFQRVKLEMEEADDMTKVKPDLVARFGKILFYGSSSICQESLKSNPFGESTFRQMKKYLYTNIPPSYVEFMENLVVEKLGLEYVQEKELYYLTLVDNLLPDSTISCKCVVSKGLKRIQLHKIELIPVRHMVVDMSCVGKSLDLRLMLCNKKIIVALSDEQINGIKDLVGSAILDTDVKGGLRWPFGKDSSGCGYAVICVAHTIAKSYRNQSIRVKLRHADRFDFRSSTGEVAREIFLKMPGIISQLRKQIVEENVMFKMLEENLKLIWNHCLLDGSSS